MTLSDRLAQLESAQLVRRMFDPEPAYIFKNVLVQETAYGSVLMKHRRELHRQVARCYELLYPDRLEELAPLLAHHYAEASDDPRATLKYARVAGDVAARRYATAEAIQHYSVALTVAQTIPDLASDALLHLYSSRGRAYELSGSYEQALANYAEMTGVGLRRNDRSLQLAALMAVAIIHSTPTPVFDAKEAQALCDRGLVLAQELGDRPAEAKILWILLLLNYFAANPGQSVAHGERAIALARELGLREQLAFALNDIHRSYMVVGEVQRATAAREEAEALWREMGNLPMLADNLNGGAEVCLWTGDFDGALALTAESEAITRSIGNSWQQSYGLMLRTVVHLERGEIAQGIADAEAGMRLAENAGFGIPLTYLRVYLAQVYAELGASDEAMELVEQALDLTDARFLAGQPFVLVAKAGIYLQQGNFSAAAATLNEAGIKPSFDESLVAAVAFGAPTFWVAEGELELRQGEHAAALSTADELLSGLHAFHMRPYLADVLRLKGQALIGSGQWDEGYRTLAEARAEAESLGSRRVLWRILACLAETAEARGRRDQAQAFRREALEVIRFIADHTGSDELASSFLGTPAVRALNG
jgi:tetratricopeptide (TPR) repeat protein